MSRLRAIKLEDSITGITFFLEAGLTWAIHVHYKDPVASSVLDTYLNIPLDKREQIVWIFVPLKCLSNERKIDALWLRTWKGHTLGQRVNETWTPSLVVIFSTYLF